MSLSAVALTTDIYTALPSLEDILAIGSTTTTVAPTPVCPIQLTSDVEMSASEIGGKAASLVRLIKLGFRVPRAWVIPCEFSLTRPAIELDGMDYGGQAYAVRSGAPVSMPGMMETKTNVAYEDLHDAINAVWNSWDSESAKAYREAHSIERSIGTAVIIQRMVPNQDKAFTAFTNSPKNVENKNEFSPIIEYVDGLGEDLVGGKKAKKLPKSSILHKSLSLHLKTIHDKWGPSDVELACDTEGNFWYLQQRSLRFVENVAQNAAIVVDGRTLLAKGTSIGCPVSVIGTLVCNKKQMEKAINPILLVENLDPALYPLMMKASAILCAQGGETCHAAIVARDMGKPALTDVPVSHLQDEYVAKPYVMVDGTTGAIMSATKEELETVEVLVKADPVVVLRPNYKLSTHQVDSVRDEYRVNKLLYRFYKAMDDHKEDRISLERRNIIVGEIAQLISTYYYVASICETRHINRMVTNGDDLKRRKEIVEALQLRGVQIPAPGDDTPGRPGFLKQGIPEPKSLQRAIEILELVDSGFNTLDWTKGFGGTKWGSISTVALAYFKGEYTDALFLDASFNLYHNGGRAFNKFDWMRCNENLMIKQLDAKRHTFGHLKSICDANIQSTAGLDTIIPVGGELTPDEDEALLTEPAKWKYGGNNSVEATQYEAPVWDESDMPEEVKNCSCTKCVEAKKKAEEELAGETPVMTLDEIDDPFDDKIQEEKIQEESAPGVEDLYPVEDELVNDNALAAAATASAESMVADSGTKQEQVEAKKERVVS